MTYQQKVIKLMDAKREMFEDWRYFTLEDRLNVFRIPEQVCRMFWEDLMELNSPGSLESCIFCYVYGDITKEGYIDERGDNIGGCVNCPYAKTHIYCINEYSLWEQVFSMEYDSSAVANMVRNIEGELE